MIVQKIIDSIEDDAPIRDVRVCLHATAVESLHIGLCGHTRADVAYEAIKRQDVVANHGMLRQFSAKNLAAYALSSLAIEASVGIAAINSILDIDWTKIRTQRAADILLEQARGKHAVVVGHFPFNERLRKEAKQFTEIGIEHGIGDAPFSEAPTILPAADVAIISANTIVNQTMDNLLGLTKNCSFVAIHGVSTILSPIFFRYGVHALLGTIVDDVETVIRNISEGAALNHLPGLTQVAMYSKDFLGV